MEFRRIRHYRLISGFSNLALTLCGFVLLFAGFTLFTDSNRILLSRLIGASSETLNNLSQPFFYYISWGLVIAGLIAIFASFIGWWATCLNNYWLLSIYFVVVLLLLLIEFSICVIITFWPQCLGLNLDEPLLVKALQANYGVPGKEQMTASIDLAQTKFKCCAINSNLNYDMSFWRLQNFGQRDYAVPKTCCILSNSHESSSFLNPKPFNLTMCQSLLKDDYSRARHIDSCLEHLDVWYRQHYVVFLSASFVLAVVEFGVLLSVILSCMQMLTQSKQRGILCRTTGTTMRTNVFAKESPIMSSIPSSKRRPAPQPQQHQQQQQQQQQQQPQQQQQSPSQNHSHFHKITPINENIYVTSGLSELSNARYRDRYSDPLKPSNAYSYHMSKSYLV